MARKNIMLATKYTTKKFNKIIESDMLILAQPKINGCRAIWDTRNKILRSSEGNIITSVPHIVDYIRKEELLSQYPLDGELYRHGLKLQEIRSVVGRTKNLHPSHNVIQYHVFDLRLLSALQEERSELLAKLLPLHHTDNPLVYVPTSIINNEEHLALFARRMVILGYEGAIVRRRWGLYKEGRTTNMLKLKAGIFEQVEIINCIEGTGKYKGTLGALIVKNELGKEFHVGSFAVDDDYRKVLWDYLQVTLNKLRHKATIRYFERSADGVPPSSVFVDLVNNIKYLEEV